MTRPTWDQTPFRRWMSHEPDLDSVKFKINSTDPDILVFGPEEKGFPVIGLEEKAKMSVPSQSQFCQLAEMHYLFADKWPISRGWHLLQTRGIEILEGQVYLDERAITIEYLKTYLKFEAPLVDYLRSYFNNETQRIKWQKLIGRIT